MIGLCQAIWIGKHRIWHARFKFEARVVLHFLENGLLNLLSPIDLWRVAISMESQHDRTSLSLVLHKKENLERSQVSRLILDRTFFL